MFIQTEPTPNPMTLKFLPGQAVLGEGTRFYTSAKAAAESPLAERLFGIDGVSAIFLGSDFVTVTKKHDMEWSLIKTDILTTIMDHYVAGKPVILGQVERKKASVEGEDAIVTQIKELIETRVRPAVAMDGGDIVFHSFADGVVKLEMHGSCSGCPSSTLTLKNGIENMLKHYIPEVVAVEAA
jgi:Fe-S cluster biogenesis protein NfuA